MSITQTIEFIDNPALIGKESKYETIEVNVPKVIESWSLSMFSFEWLTQDGKIKDSDTLSEREAPKRAKIETLLKDHRPIPKAVLGIGIQDNVEIGIGRAHFLTVASKGIKTIPVHIPKSNHDDFKAFLA